MKLHYYQGLNGVGNFGDQLNPYLWSRLLPDLERRGSPEWIFVGIGTLLNERLPKAKRTIVFGAGVGYGSAVPSPDPSWQVYFVRGPRSATALGLSSRAALTDPGILVARVWREQPRARRRCAFMPHWNNANSWVQRLCHDVDIAYIDPRWPVEKVLRSIAESRVLLSEAMHGAIVADALRIPWIPIRSGSGVLTFKWLDWCESIGSPYVPRATASLWEPSNQGPLGTARAWAKGTIVANQLKRIAQSATPCLSPEQTCRRLLAAVEQRLDQFQADTDPDRR